MSHLFFSEGQYLSVYFPLISIAPDFDVPEVVPLL